MSAKSSLIHGKDFHLYKDCFDDEHVYLHLDNTEFEATQNSICVKISAAIWEVIRQQVGIDLFWASQSDDDISQYVENQVDERFKKYELNPHFAMNVIDFIPLGLVTDPREKQIEQGITYYQDVREQQRAVTEQILALQNHR
jgi:hypothetical protein